MVKDNRLRHEHLPVLRGKIGEFSLDALVNMLAHAGMRVELKVKKAA